MSQRSVQPPSSARATPHKHSMARMGFSCALLTVLWSTNTLFAKGFAIHGTKAESHLHQDRPHQRNGQTPHPIMHRQPRHQSILQRNVQSQSADPSQDAAVEDADNDNYHGSEDSGEGNDYAMDRSTIQLGKDELADKFDFPLDDWQLLAGGEILKGHNVVVCAPTGSGKTVVGEMALHTAYNEGLEGIYTTPLKALSNQKYSELRQVFGSQHVGLSTGDTSINRRNARVTVMTTEVYRNIAWRASGRSSDENRTAVVQEVDSIYPVNDLNDNAVVVLDEFHYMGQPGRGGVWEECIITSPKHTQIVGLSATLPNAAQLAEWIEGVTGRKTVLIEAPGARPVPLRYTYATREGLFPLFRNPDAGPGAPLGLLGYRGDGVPPTSTEAKKPKRRRGKGNFVSEYDEMIALDESDDKIPRGLQVNPALRAAAQRRMQRVNRSLEQQRQRQRKPWEDESSDRLYKVDKRRKMSPREERRERERLLKREMRKAVPSMPVLLTRMKQKKLLPAIVFIFSRAGCNQAAETIVNYSEGPRDPTRDVLFGDETDGSSGRPQRKKSRPTRQRGRHQPEATDDVFRDQNGRTFRPGSDQLSDDVIKAMMDGDGAEMEEYDDTSVLAQHNWDFYASAGFLEYHEVESVASRITQFNEDNPEISFDDSASKQFMFGVGSHHAGMLPAHKAFVETVYRAGLMKAVFATETLAAGINMPARSTVICALAKRGDSSAMNLLETANLLQMSGRAGRRGMDTDGTCVIVATPFESHEDAALILTNPIKPVVSQFRPSYSLTVNLVRRGRGKLDVAKNLVRNSFAMWEKRQLELSISSANQHEGVEEILESSSHEKFMGLLVDTLQRLIDRKNPNYDIGKLKSMVSVLKDRDLLKSCSKQFIGKSRSFELETTTLSYLQSELSDLEQNQPPAVFEGEGGDSVMELFEGDRAAMLEQIENQEERVKSAAKEIKRHPYNRVAIVANELMEGDSEDGRNLLAALRKLRKSSDDDVQMLSPRDLSTFAKSTIVIRRKLRKLARSNPGIDPEELLLKQTKVEETNDDSWDDMVAITKVLVAYGCLSAKVEEDDEQEDDDGDVFGKSFEQKTFQVTPAGEDVGMLGFENSLWCYVSMGGTYDITREYLVDQSPSLSPPVGEEGDEAGANNDIAQASDDEDDEFTFDLDADDDGWADEDFEFGIYDAPKKQPKTAYEETEAHLNNLRNLEPYELAGYMSCLVSEGARSGGSVSVLDTFQKMTPNQQRAVQSSLNVMEHFVDVQKKFDLDEKIAKCGFDITNCAVATAWAGGCTWTEAMEISGAAPGDLARTLSRALDAVRQFGNLKYSPMRKEDYESGSLVDPFSRGLHPHVRSLCRDAAKTMNRYPVKDPLPFEATEDDIFEDGDEDDNDDDADIDGGDDNIDTGSEFDANESERVEEEATNSDEDGENDGTEKPSSAGP